MGSEVAPPKKSEANGSEIKEVKKLTSGVKGKAVETEVSAQQTQPQSQHIEKAKDLKVEVPVVSAAGPSLNDDAHHINNVSYVTLNLLIVNNLNIFF